MTICKYYLQGKCRYGNRCWNEHPDTSRAPEHYYGAVSQPNYRHGGDSQISYQYGDNSRTRYHHGGDSQISYYGGDSHTNYHYGDDYYRKYHYHNPRYSPPSSGSHFSSTAQRNRDTQHQQIKQEVSFSFSEALAATTKENQFAVLGEDSNVSKSKENEDIECVKDDMKRWELGKQWHFSCYAPFKVCLTGFNDISPEELRWEYYEAKKSGTVQAYLQAINKCEERMKLRRTELKTASPEAIASMQSQSIKEMQQVFTFRNTQSTANFKISDSGPTGTTFGTEKPPEQMFGNASSNFKFNLSDSSEEPKPFMLTQFRSQNNKVNLFGNVNQTTSMETNIFGSPNNGRTPFSFHSKDPNSTNIHSSAGLSNIGNGELLGGSELETQSNVTDSTYTEWKMLSKSEKEEYTSSAKTFTLGRIPTKPPPKELCF